MQGFLTQGIIAGLLMTFVVTVGLTLYSELGTSYNASLTSTENNVLSSSSSKGVELQQLAYQTQQAQQNATIDETVTDFAQLQGIAGSEGQKKNGFDIFLYSLSQLQTYIPFDPSVTKLILAIIATLIGAATVYLIIGRWI